MKKPTVPSVKSVPDYDKRIDLVNQITDLLAREGASITDALNIMANVYCNQLFFNMERHVPSEFHMPILANSLATVEFIMSKWMTNPNMYHFVLDMVEDHATDSTVH